MITKVVKNANDDIISTTSLIKQIENGENNAILGICKYGRIYKLTRAYDKHDYYWINLNSIDHVWENPNEDKNLEYILKQMHKIVTITNIEDIHDAIDYLRTVEES